MRVIQNLNPLCSCVRLYGAADLSILLEVVLVESTYDFFPTCALSGYLSHSHTFAVTLSLRVLAIYSGARRGKFFVAAVAIIVIALGAVSVPTYSLARVLSRHLPVDSQRCSSCPGVTGLLQWDPRPQTASSVHADFLLVSQS
jgi:hypothetical protein